MAVKILLAVMLLLQFYVRTSALEDYLFKYERTTPMFEECENQLHQVKGELLKVTSGSGKTILRFVPKTTRSFTWVEQKILAPYSLLKCFTLVENLTNVTAKMLKYTNNRCYYTAQDSYNYLVDEPSCLLDPSEVVYVFT